MSVARAATGDRTTRLYRYFQQNDGWLDRDRIMHWTGFPSPKAQPILAYVEFHNALDHLNRLLAKSGSVIAGGLETGEKYHLERIQP